MSRSEDFIDRVREEHPVWIVHRIPRPNTDPAMRTLQQEIRVIPGARSTFFAWSWVKPTLRVPIVSGRLEGTGGKGRLKGLGVDDLMWAFARDAPHGLWAREQLAWQEEQALFAWEWTVSQRIVRAALCRAVREFNDGYETGCNLLGEDSPAVRPTDLENLVRYAPTVIPSSEAHRVLTLATVMG